VIETGTCPVCGGGRSVAGKPCHNCGGQTMSRTPTGIVPVRVDGTPCEHSYIVRHTHRDTLTRFVCKYCIHAHSIDSGD
jgi:DnaJ-class molecular chaperone